MCFICNEFYSRVDAKLRKGDVWADYVCLHLRNVTKYLLGNQYESWNLLLFF